MPIKVRMIPHLDDLSGESGINTAVRKWFEYLPKYDIELVGREQDSFDLMAVHAGMTDRQIEGVPTISHLHGAYWSADYPAQTWEWASNAQIVKTIRQSKVLTVPSSWVAETFQRDMRVNPFVVPHGVDLKEWKKPSAKGKYVIGYLKNRSYVDVCNPQFLTDLASRFPDIEFISTFPIPGNAPNVRITGLMSHDKIADLMRDALAVISPIKETFGILTLEAMASGIPVLGYDYGGNKDLVRHGETGYLARVNDGNDLAEGLSYCIEHRSVLGSNARNAASMYTWDAVCKNLAGIYHTAVMPEKPTVSVVIPSYNYAEKLPRAIESVLAQTVPVQEIIIVDDGSPDDGATERVVSDFSMRDDRVKYIRQGNSGVAVARNRGIDACSSPYCICLDADDALAPQFVEACLPELEKDQSLGIAFTKILAVIPDGRQQVSQWPDGWNYDEQLKRHNQVPTACMFRKEMWRRLGGYRQRYAPNGAGSEDAEFWLRSGAYGWKAKMVTDAPLFIYSLGTGNVSGNKQYREVDWTSLHPWCRDGNHPFTSYATPVGTRYSHPVRQYDEPIVSVIIPVKSGHKSLVFNALDSLEAQTFRKWEAIVIDDADDENEKWSFDGVDNMLEAYPYVRMLKTPGKKGAGYARNRGVEAARGSMILFLDADDNFLSGDAIQMMMDTWNATGQIVYTDYVGKSYLDAGAVDMARRSGRLVDYNEKTGLAMTRSNASEYDCERALAQPQEPFYIWNLITSLLPKAWHNEIGGFDENMESWEDWVYWLMLARAGKCFIRIPEPLVVYRFYTGERREYGIKNARELVQYIIKKFSGVKTMPCGCSKKNPGSAVVRNAAVVDSKAATQAIKDDEVVLIVYTNPNTGMHRVVGVATGTDYGYRSGGGTDKFYVMREDQRNRSDWFNIVTQAQPTMEEAVTPPPPPKDRRKRNVVK